MVTIYREMGVQSEATLFSPTVVLHLFLAVHLSNGHIVTIRTA